MNDLAYQNIDRWWEARQKSARYQGSISDQIKVVWSTLSLPGQATKTVPMQILTTGRGLGVDLNLYRDKVNVKMLADLGVQIFDLRLFGPSYWVYGDWRYKQDPTFEPYYNILSQIPDIMIGAYGVYNPWLDEESGYSSRIDPNVELMKLYTKNFITGLHYVMWDVEVGKCTKGSNLENGITDANLVKGLSRAMIQTRDELPALRPGYKRIPEMYSANWFLKQYGGEGMKVWLENTMANPQDLPMLTWLAWVPTVFTQTFAKPQDLFDKLITPNGVQENAFLHLRSEPLATKWQCSWTLKGPWEPNTGIDCSVTYGVGAQYKDYRWLHNVTVTTPPPPGDDNGGDNGGADAALTARVTAIEAEIAAIKSMMSKARVTYE